ncbi:uncharacterized protein LOC114313892 [Camellia sinensis]|uniref:uncharacterized protein LOC114313892 n=1 Tax=Camellia sinensis TaxID=4442 RepID=UPI0010360E43|nr:uncharacterized protein LOC114313892 [Camellia sinensis]
MITPHMAIKFMTPKVEVKDEIIIKVETRNQNLTNPKSNATDVKERGAKSNFAEKEEEVSLLMACNITEDTHKRMWYLDTGSSNHMCGNKSIFSELDESFHSTVKFGDDSTISVMGKGTIQIQTSKSAKQTISNVFYVPGLKTNLLSVGQLQEKGYEIIIKEGTCRIHDPKMGLITQVNMTANRMFPLYIQNDILPCFSAMVKDLA